MRNEPLGLPRGSVRGILTLLLVVPVPVMLLLSAFGFIPDVQVLAWYGPLALMVVKDYFGTRQVNDAVSEEPADIALGLNDDDTYAVGERDA